MGHSLSSEEEQCRLHCGPSVCNCGLVLGISVTVLDHSRNFSNAEVLHGHPRVCLRMLSFRPQFHEHSWDWRVRSSKKKKKKKKKEEDMVKEEKVEQDTNMNDGEFKPEKSEE